MNRLLEVLRSFGTAGAVVNAGALASDRRREDWVVTALDRRIARALPAGAAVRRTA